MYRLGKKIGLHKTEKSGIQCLFI